MASLTLGAFEARVLEGSFAQKPSLFAGARVRTASNRLRSSERDEKRVYECQIDLYDATEEAALRAACPRGTLVAIAGDLVDVGFDGIVDIQEITKTTAEDDTEIVDVLRAASLHIEEV